MREYRSTALRRLHPPRHEPVCKYLDKYPSISRTRYLSHHAVAARGRGVAAHGAAHARHLLSKKIACCCSPRQKVSRPTRATCSPVKDVFGRPLPRQLGGKCQQHFSERRAGTEDSYLQQNLVAHSVCWQPRQKISWGHPCGRRYNTRPPCRGQKYRAAPGATTLAPAFPANNRRGVQDLHDYSQARLAVT